MRVRSSGSEKGLKRDVVPDLPSRLNALLTHRKILNTFSYLGDAARSENIGLIFSTCDDTY